MYKEGGRSSQVSHIPIDEPSRFPSLKHLWLWHFMFVCSCRQICFLSYTLLSLDLKFNNTLPYVWYGAATEITFLVRGAVIKWNGFHVVWHFLFWHPYFSRKGFIVHDVHWIYIIVRVIPIYLVPFHITPIRGLWFIEQQKTLKIVHFSLQMLKRMELKGRFVILRNLQ